MRYLFITILSAFLFSTFPTPIHAATLDFDSDGDIDYLDIHVFINPLQDSIFQLSHLIYSFATIINLSPTPTPSISPTPPPGCNKTVNSGQSIQTAITDAISGQIICVTPGTYSELINISKPLTLRASDPNDKPVIEGNHTIPSSCGMPDPSTDRCYSWTGLVEITTSNVTLDSFVINRSKGRGINIHGDISNILVTNTDINEAWGSGINIQEVSNITIDNNTLIKSASFAPYYRGSAELNWPGALAVKNTDGFIATNNFLDDTYGEGIIVDTNRGKDTNVIIKCNTIVDTMRPSLYIHGNVDGVKITDNHTYSSPDYLGGKVWEAGLVVVETEVNSIIDGKIYYPRNGFAKNNKVENGMVLKSDFLTYQNNGPHVTVNCPK